MSQFATIGANIAFQMKPIVGALLWVVKQLLLVCGVLSAVKASASLKIGNLKKPIKIKFPKKLPTLKNKKAAKIVTALTEELKDFLMTLIMAGVPAYLNGYSEAAVEWRRESLVLQPRTGDKVERSWHGALPLQRAKVTAECEAMC